ncbi:transcriptional regulator, LysR family [Pseudomonas congelans]|uniref:LysR family transcriptional regulator n=1 Tax=Pseudomonas congelans TaxID=200452 RepID=A0A0P9M0F8_9PSED|nr:LysR substrate-binding domain-containing protein [Pseudomonas congelans]MBP1143392.1 DNA-binding transcriptional LysR family regulator [Pseudomonas sp. PvP027]KPW84377.1 LysR family transcriptional regulator [Pseudomonas congelans]MBC8801353.1 LysR family transcriptional regulator [Pseudomonas congelans]MCF5167247.1 LysR family transcriptional regulator [Pseudomonas congelans]PBP97096.1 LysR family transcriptional regulator [Pseudomonas congelans]
MRIEPLPPLQNLIAFEAAVRHGSFTRAATELNLTQSAISRQVAQLEEFLGRALFRREHKRIHLTVAGQIYAEQIQRVLTLCAEATAQVITHSGDQQLTLACSSGVAALWLGPLLGRYRDAFPAVDIRLRVVDGLDSLIRAEFDLALYFLREVSPAGLDSRLLFAESVNAYCSPDYLDGRLLEPAQLLEHCLLMLEDGQRQWLSWGDWFGRQGVDASLIRKRMTVNLYPVLVDLAVAGHGIVLGWQPMIDRHVRSGALVPACRKSVGAVGGYYLLTPSGKTPRRAARAFEKWLADEIATLVPPL